MATKTNTRAKNPGQLKLTGGQAKKPAANKANAATTKKKPAYTRNPSPGANTVLFVVGGVVAVKVIDTIIRWLAPKVAPLASVIGTGVAGFVVGNFVPRYLPLSLRPYAAIASFALYFKAGLTAWDEWVSPRLPAAFGGSAGLITAKSVTPIQDPATGNKGYEVALSNGDNAIVYDAPVYG